MKAYIEYIRISLKLALRDRVTLFFNYIFPLIFFVVFAQAFHAGQGGAIVQVVTMVLIIGILGSGFFGAGVRAVQERETNILRRFKVAPISPLPILIASMVTGFLTYMPTVLAVLAIAYFRYGLRVTAQLPALLVFAGLGILAFRAVGLIIASVVNSAQESQILVQMLYLPMLFLSGATFPVSELPGWLQIAAQFLPATYLYTGMQGILFRHEGLLTNWLPVLGLIVTGVLATFIGMKLFRWEKEEKIAAANKAWLVAVLAPFLLIGAYQAYSRDNVAKARILYRELRRSRTVLIEGARIFPGDGTVISQGAVLVRGGRIAEIYRGPAPPAASLQAEALEASGKTLLPGLMDAEVHLSAPGGIDENGAGFEPERDIPRELAAYLYSGVTSVRSAGDRASLVFKLRQRFRGGERLGADLLLAGTVFTGEGCQGREACLTPKSPREAREQVRVLKQQGVDGIQVALETGPAGIRLDPDVVRAIVEQARELKLPVVARTGTLRDVADAVAAGVDAIVQGTARAPIP
ncbi:MAG: ABC transporter permease, partial [Acidobacteria bacterium]|nr:ABC transporter permease [Acidobacteriota bacterium]